MNPLVMLLVLVSILTVFKGNTQDINGIYSCEYKPKGTVKIYISNDTVAVLYPNHDAFATHSLFIGSYSLKNTTVQLGNNDILKYTSDLTYEATTSQDNIRVTFLDVNQLPIQYIMVRIAQGKRKEIIKSTNEYGDIFISRNDLQDASLINVKLEMLGNSTKQTLDPTLGIHYTICSIIPDNFAFLEMIPNDISVKVISNEQIELHLKRRSESFILSKTDKCLFVLNCLLNDLK